MNKQKIRSILLVITVIMLVILVAGCSTKSANSGKQQSPAGSNQAATTTEAAKPQTTSKEVAKEPAAKTKEEPKPLKKVKLQIVTHTTMEVNEYVAINKGYFQEEGFEVEFVTMKGPIVGPALVNGELEYATNAELGGILKGLPNKILALIRAGTDWGIYAQPNIKKLPEDLVGKTIGTSGIGSGDYNVMSDWLNKKGVNVNQVNFVAIGGTPDRLAGLVSKSIDVGPLLPPYNWTAEQEGMAQIGFPEELIKSYRSGVQVSDKKLTKDREEIKRFLSAMIKGLHYTHKAVANKNTDEIVKIIAQYVQEDPQKIKEAFEFSYPILTKNGLPDLKDYQRHVSEQSAVVQLAKSAQISAVADFSLLEEVLSKTGRMPE